MLEFVTAVVGQTARSFVFSGALVLSVSLAISAFGADHNSAPGSTESFEGVVLESAFSPGDTDQDLFRMSSQEGGVVPAHMPLPAGAIVSVDEQNGRVIVTRMPTRRRFYDNFVMVLDVADRSLLTGLSAGDRIRFDYESGTHRWVLTRLEHSN